MTDDLTTRDPGRHTQRGRVGLIPVAVAPPPPLEITRTTPVAPALSEARRKALDALHAARRGRRVNDPGVAPEYWQALRARLVAATAVPLRADSGDPLTGISRRALAGALGVSDKTIRRWLSGEDQPSGDEVERLRAWAEERRI